MIYLYLPGGNTVGPGTDVIHSLMGVYKALFYRNIPVAFVHTKDLSETTLSPDTAVYIPFPITLSDNASKGVLLVFVTSTEISDC